MMITFQIKTPCFRAITACFQVNIYVSKLTWLVSNVTIVFPNSYFCYQLDFVSKLTIIEKVFVSLIKVAVDMADDA